MNALDMDYISCSCCDSYVLEEDFGRVRSCLALIKKGLKKVTGFLIKKFSLGTVALLLALPFFLAPATAYLRSSGWRNRPKPTPLAPRPRPLALVKESSMQCRV